jgi:hypothetical protein
MASKLVALLVIAAAGVLGPPRCTLVRAQDMNSDGDGDGDGDGVPDTVDWCPRTPAFLSPEDTLDVDTGCSQQQLDADMDGWCNPNLPTRHGLEVTTPMCTGMDNCPFVPNPQQTDTFGDLRGDACDPGLWRTSFEWAT